jgi:cell division protein FtsB
MSIKNKAGFFLPLLRNKYSFSLIVFFLWIVFFDSNNLIERVFYLKQMHQLEKDKIFYERKIKEDQIRLDELKSNPTNLEKFAREHYLMKKDNEDIFIIDH